MHIPKCDDDCFMAENEFGFILVGSIWEIGESNMIGGEIHLDCISGCDDFAWIEIPNEHFESCFKKIDDYECDGCDYQIITDGVEFCEKDPESKNPLCPLIPVFESEGE